jgi:hypothetical protein
MPAQMPAAPPEVVGQGGHHRMQPLFGWIVGVDRVAYRLGAGLGAPR